MIVEFLVEVIDFEFKFVLFDKDKKFIWEGINNRSLFFGKEDILNYEVNWDEFVFIDFLILVKFKFVVFL